MYTETFAQLKKHLGQLDKWLGAAADYAKSKNFDPDVSPRCASFRISSRSSARCRLPATR
jgi:hypothetical protein